MLGTLTPVGGGDPIPLLKPILIIGRRPSCDIVLDFPNVSTRHCELALTNGYWRAKDLNSSNGVKVNNERIDEKFLQPGDTIAIAKHRFEIQYTPDPNAAAPIEEVDPFAMSLLEKAGLGGHEPRPRRTKDAPPPKPKVEAPKKPPSEMDDDDRALHWMSDE